MKRKDVINTIYSLSADVPKIFTTGYTCRDAFQIGDRNSNFYMVGSMGLAVSIGIGIAICNKDIPIIVVEGDGSFLMCPNNIFIAGSLRLNNLIHIVIDNKMYESTGRQETISKDLNLTQIAFCAGYKICKRIVEIDEFANELNTVVNFKKGPVFFHLIVDVSKSDIGKRVSIPLVKLRKRFSDYLKM